LYGSESFSIFWIRKHCPTGEIVRFRLLYLAAVLATAACADKSPYAPGRSAADIPATIDVIRMEKLADLGVWNNDEDPEKNLDPAPSENDREVMAVAKAAIVAQFENFGMHIVEDDSRKPDLAIRVYVSYIPELGLFVHRTVTVRILVRDTDGNLIFKEFAGHVNATGVLDAMFTSRDGLVAQISRDIVQTTVKELQKGTKRPSSAGATVGTPSATPLPAPPSAVPST
jgi:hypothetical protein